MSDEPNTLPAVPAKPRPISRRIKKAIATMVRGEAKTITAAADLAGLSREALSRALQKSHVIQYLHDKTARALAIAAGQAGATKIALLDSANARVRNEASTFVLGLAGIKPADDPRTAVNINMNVRAGWIVDLRDELKASDPPTPAPKIIEHEPAAAVPCSSEIESEIDDAK